MTPKKGGLGRGLDALFADNSLEEVSVASAVKLKLLDIEPNRNQPRKLFDEKALAELAESIAQHGVLQPLLVRPIPDGGYQLIAGERRWRAARLAGLSEVPVVVREMSDDEAMALSLIENLQREDLNPIEEAQGLQTLMDKTGLSQEETAERVGKSRPAVANAVRLLKLPGEIIDFVLNGKISAGHARALLAFKDETNMLATARLVVAKGISVREVERLAKAADRKKPEEKAKPKREAYFDEVELALANALGRKVKVATDGKKPSGTLELAFYDKEDLGRLAGALRHLED